MSIHSNGSPTLSASIDQLAPHITEREQLEDGPLTSRGVEEQATHHKELGAHENHHPAPLPTPLPSPSASAAPEENVPVETAENLQISPPSPEETPVTSPVSRNISLRKDATAFAESEAEQSDDPSSATCPSTTTTLNESATVKSSEPEPPPTTTHPPFDEHEGKRDSTEPLPTPFTSPDTSILSPTVSISLLSTSLSGTTAATSTSEPEIVNSGGVSTNDHHTAAATAAAAVAAAAADTGDHLDRAAASRQTEWTTQIDALHKNTFPHDEIDQAVTDDTVPFGVLVDLFNQGASEVSDWIAAANIAVFALEHDIKRGTGKRDTTELDALMCGFRQNVELLAELADVIGERDLSDDDVDAYRETPQSAADAALPDDALLAFLLKKKSGVSLQSKKLQSEWSGLTHFLASIKKELNDTLQRKELAETMDDILKQIEELSMAIFKFQEERHASALGASENDDSTPNQQSFFPGMIASPSNSTPALGAASPFEGVTPQSAPTFGLHTDPPPRDSRTRDDLALMQIDAKAEPLFNTIESIYTLLSSPSAPADPSGAIKRKHALVADKWENLRTEIEELKEEVKDERWIEMFRSSADQVSSMIEGLDRTVAQCHLMIAQIKTWQQEQQAAIAQAMQAHPPPQNHLLSRGGGMLRTRQSASPIGNGSGIPRPGRRSTTPASPVTSSALSSLSILTDPTIAAAAAIKPPVDKEHVLSQTKNFEAKSRNYTPAIDRMLTMLGNSIASRTNRDVDAQRRFEAMSERWTNLKGAMDDLRNRDLPDMEKAVSEHPISPSARSEVSDRSARSAKSGRILSPEPGSVGRPQSPTFRRFFSGAGAGAIRSIGSSSPNPYDEEVRAARNGGRGTPNTARESGWNRPASNRRISTPSPAPGQHGYAGGIGSSNRTSSPLSFTNGPRPGRSSARRGDNSNSNRTTSPTESRDDSSYSSSPSVSNVTSFAGVGRASKVYGLGNTSVASMSSAGTSNGKPMWNVSTKMDRTNYLEFGPLWKEESEGGDDDDEERGRSRRSKTPLSMMRPKTPAGERKDSTLMNPTKSSIYRREQSLPRYQGDTERGRDRSMGPRGRDRSVGPFMRGRERSVGPPEKRERSMGPFMRGRDRSAGPYGRDERGRDRSAGPYGRDERRMTTTTTMTTRDKSAGPYGRDERKTTRDKSAGPYGRDERKTTRDKSAGPYGRDERGRGRDRSVGRYGADERERPAREQSLPRYMQSTTTAARKSKTPLVQQQQPNNDGQRSITPSMRPKTPSVIPNRPKTPTSVMRPKTPTWHGNQTNGTGADRTVTLQMQITLPAPSGPYQYPDRDRAVSPTGGNKRTSKSPSLIPRPRTPLVSGSRPTSPSEVADDGFKPGFLRATTPNSNRPLTPSNLSAVAAAIATSPPPPVPKLPTEYASILSSASSQNSLLSVVNEAYPATVATATSQASDPPNNASVRKSNIPRKSFTPVLTKKPSISHLFQQSNGDSGTESPKQSISSTLNQIYRTHEDDYDDYMRSLDVSISEPDPYTPDPRDPLDVELAKVLNSSPIRFKCERLPQGQGKYSFGSELNRKVYMCKLMNYKDKEGSSGRRSMVPGNRNKVLVRVGGGWQDLEAFLFDHMDLMMSNVTVKRW